MCNCRRSSRVNKRCSGIVVKPLLHLLTVMTVYTTTGVVTRIITLQQPCMRKSACLNDRNQGSIGVLVPESICSSLEDESAVCATIENTQNSQKNKTTSHHQFNYSIVPHHEMFIFTVKCQQC